MSKFKMFAVLCFWLITIASALPSENPIARSFEYYEPDIEPYDDRLKLTRPIFNYRKNGVKIDVRVVPTTNDSIFVDNFPEFPARDISFCLFHFSMDCFRDRVARFIDAIGRLNEIPLWGSDLKLVKTKSLLKNTFEARMFDNVNDGVGKIERRIEDFLDSFALRINLPRSNGRRERNQIDIMLDDNNLVEGRGKKGGGGKGGGKCKKMMMMMLMMGKMKLMAWAGMMSMKGMMMAGMSLMISKAMLIMKLMSLKMGQGGGGGGGGGGGQLKEIVLLTKAGGGGGPPPDSYGAPPPSSYGPPSNGGGGYDYSGGGGGGGGGWGRSFNDRISMAATNDQSEIIYPSIDSSDYYQNFDVIPQIQSLNNSLGARSTVDLNDTTVSRLLNSWNYTDNTSGIPTLNEKMYANFYNPKSNEFDAEREKKLSLDEKIDHVDSKFVRPNYAKKWQNYHAADEYSNPRTERVVMGTSRFRRISKPMPIGA